MADSKISALSAITSLSAADQLAVAHSGASNSIRGDHMPGFKLDYVEITSSVTVTATAAASATTVIDGNAISLDGSTLVKVEFHTELAEYNVAGNELIVVLYDGSTQLGYMCEVEIPTSAFMGCALKGERYLTPSNGSHTFHIKAFKTSGSGTATIYAASGGAGARLPAWYRVTVA